MAGATSRLAAHHHDQVGMPGRGCHPHRRAAASPMKDCARWHTALPAKIHAGQPDMVIASTYDGYAFVGAPDKRTAAERAALAAGTHPEPQVVPSRCAARGDARRHVPLGQAAFTLHDAAPAGPVEMREAGRTRTVGLFGQGRDQAAKRAARNAHASFRPTRQIVCTYEPVRTWSTRYLVTTDGGHLTATYSAKSGEHWTGSSQPPDRRADRHVKHGRDPPDPSRQARGRDPSKPGSAPRVWCRILRL